MTIHARTHIEKKRTIVETMTTKDTIEDTRKNIANALTLAEENADRQMDGADLEIFFIIRSLRSSLVNLEALTEMI